MSQEAASSSGKEGSIFFWRETDEKTGYLSQWYYCPFTDKDDPSKVYKTAEQTPPLLKKSSVGHPRKVKSLGRKVKNFDEKEWNTHREQVVLQGNILKFTRAVSEEGLRFGSGQHGEEIRMKLKELLLSTGEQELVEASPFDKVWGVGFKPSDAAAHRGEWGLNLLGKALMEVRRILREEEEREGVKMQAELRG